MKYQFIDDNKKHLHQIDLGDGWKNLTGVSTISGVCPPPLTWWASGMACAIFGRLDPKKHASESRLKHASEVLAQIKELDDQAYLDLLEKAYRAHNDKKEVSAESGTDLHKELEEYIVARINGHEISYSKKIEPFVLWEQKEVKRFIWVETCCFDTDLWIAGISDVGVELNNGEYAIVDFKSSKEAYPSQFWQMGGYNILISKNGGYTRTGEQLFTLDKPITQHIIFPFGAEKVEPVIDRDVEGHKNAFRACATLYREKEKLNKTI